MDPFAQGEQNFYDAKNMEQKKKEKIQDLFLYGEQPKLLMNP